DLYVTGVQTCALPILAEARGFVVDLDGCVWTGEVLVPGAAEVLALLRSQGRAVSFLTNNSRARAETLRAKLERLGVQAAAHEVRSEERRVGKEGRGWW